MWDAVLSFFKFLFDLFNALPDDAKAAAKEKVADGFENLFREYFRAESGG